MKNENQRKKMDGKRYPELSDVATGNDLLDMEEHLKNVKRIELRKKATDQWAEIWSALCVLYWHQY